MISYKMVILSVLIFVFAALYFKTREGLTSLQPTDYSSQNNISDDGLLLKGYYRTRENPGISQHNSADGLRLYPKTEMSSYEQKTNNKRHWFTPCDGSSIRADMCGALYKGKALKKQHMVEPSMTSGRVNMYDAAEF
jgi:hypothetical protein